MKDVRAFDRRLDREDYEDDVRQMLAVIQPDWDLTAVTVEKFTTGLTNTLVGCYHGGCRRSMLLFRIYGDGTELFIDRDGEKRMMQVMHRAGRAPALRATFSNGLVYGFQAGSTLSTSSVRAPEVVPLVAAEVATLHRIQPTGLGEKQDVCLWASLERMMKNAPAHFDDPLQQKRFVSELRSPTELRSELRQLRAEVEALGSPVVLCHNDLLLENLILAPDGSGISFIDFEYGGFNYQAFDIANHFNEFPGTENVDYSLFPGRDLQLVWLRHYLETFLSTPPGPAPQRQPDTVQPSEEQVHRLYVQVNKFSLLSHFYWGCWALAQTRFSQIDFDYLHYAIVRFNEYDRRKKVVADL